MFVFIDAHVHIYPEFQLDKFFFSAWDNFSIAAREANIEVSEAHVFVLALTEGAGYDFFTNLKKQAVCPMEPLGKQASLTSWNVYPTAETDSLCIRFGDSVIYLTAGRQLVSCENIELLSLFSSKVFQDHKFSLVELAQAVSDSGGIPVVPWGVGKWLGRRGRVVGNLLKERQEFPLFLGDNGNRPIFWPLPVLLQRAADLDIPCVSGSDPLPILSHSRRPGSFGIMLKDKSFSCDAPNDSLRKLFTRRHEVSSFGHGTGSIQFIIDQFRVNLRKRLGHKFLQ